MIPRTLLLGALLLGWTVAAPSAYTGKVQGWTDGPQTIGLVMGKNDVLISGKINAAGQFTLTFTASAAQMRPYLRETARLLPTNDPCVYDRCALVVSDPEARWNIVKALYVQGNPKLASTTLLSGDDLDAQIDIMDPDPFRPLKAWYFAYADRPVTITGNVVTDATPTTGAWEQRYDLKLPAGWSMVEAYEETHFAEDQTLIGSLTGMRSVPLASHPWQVKR
ncbi:hypothetical protein [Deinococcus multiflagellatus]|uniref:hypothetical protein n=1 Tax=Deinococcus multiflagellatus TaxID=1656887 RepID=UPI001CCE1DBC|nr:hypothetical protein [Deinococcus multiflagellatus]MBZ9714542.1 hypothetical protein [Deinococcus multiflagellatus]